MHRCALRNLECVIVPVRFAAALAAFARRCLEDQGFAMTAKDRHQQVRNSCDKAGHTLGKTKRFRTTQPVQSRFLR